MSNGQPHEEGITPDCIVDLERRSKVSNGQLWERVAEGRVRVDTDDNLSHPHPPLRGTLFQWERDLQA